MATTSTSTSTARVRVIARLRPPLPGEVCDDGVRVVSHVHRGGEKEKENVNDTQPSDLAPGILILKDPSSSSLTQQTQHYPFHSAYTPHDASAALFERDVFPLLSNVLGGSTVTIFAYGVTSSGKTHTMQGEDGIIGMVVDELFKGGGDLDISMSYLELYLDAPYDLLVPPTQRRKLQILSTVSRGTNPNPKNTTFGHTIHLPHLSTHPISSVAEFHNLYQRGVRHRSTGATLLNSGSSRSHAVLTFYVGAKGKLHLLDLAGSENNNLTGNDPQRMRESAAINTSLSALGQVVGALNEKSGGSGARIPYRSSNLTRLLSDALGGTSLALLIVCLAPGIKFRGDLVRSVNNHAPLIGIEETHRPIVQDVQFCCSFSVFQHRLAFILLDINVKDNINIDINISCFPPSPSPPSIPSIPHPSECPRPFPNPVRVRLEPQPELKPLVFVFTPFFLTVFLDLIVPVFPVLLTPTILATLAIIVKFVLLATIPRSGVLVPRSSFAPLAPVSQFSHGTQGTHLPGGSVSSDTTPSTSATPAKNHTTNLSPIPERVEALHLPRSRIGRYSGGGGGSGRGIGRTSIPSFLREARSDVYARDEQQIRAEKKHQDSGEDTISSGDVDVDVDVMDVMMMDAVMDDEGGRELINIILHDKFTVEHGRPPSIHVAFGKGTACARSDRRCPAAIYK
ncbi:P-loop containing nucleoside triphosphate hydrolase protein [Lentinula edodes]|nr:P-loop containing nucleoside triphosphate hydrolase protein [Lentinula edodes]